ncbi:DNA polymerase III subunit delta [Sphingomonas sp.]|uniref:DNA polymerase III subunit delta n=1 Tax=Sphingomonas sp. TaxID=28214 RepID=UPI001B2EC260|nr:DNA polymerase III subunit delta [Sphingomonas sp.]MBO9714729.1 DNA polymerase III subunit delta [Sphingomonas sp.]
MKASAAQIRAELDKPSGRFRIYLLHGPDESGAAELAERLIRAMGPGTERVDIDPRRLRDSPGLLADEAASMSLFGEKRLIRLMGADEACAEAFNLLIGAEAAGNPVVAIGPGLKASGKLVKLAVAAPSAMAHGCYVPEAGEITRIAAMIAREHGLRLTSDVPQRLAAACGGDRAILTREIEKLALYLDSAPDRPKEADGRALDAVGADLGEAEASGVIDAVIDGRVAEVGEELARLAESGGQTIPLMRQLARRLLTLAELRSEVDAGADIDDVIEKHRIFFREKASTARALRRWNAVQLARALDRVRKAERGLMHGSSAGDVLAEAECVAVTRAAARARA